MSEKEREREKKGNLHNRVLWMCGFVVFWIRGTTLKDKLSSLLRGAYNSIKLHSITEFNKKKKASLSDTDSE